MAEYSYGLVLGIEPEKSVFVQVAVIRYVLDIWKILGKHSVFEGTEVKNDKGITVFSPAYYVIGSRVINHHVELPDEVLGLLQFDEVAMG